MSNRFYPPRSSAFDANGSPLSGAKLNFYESGTSTPLDTYSDDSLTSANANPVVADSAGRFGEIFLKGQDYKVVLTDSDDVTIWTADPVAGGSGDSATFVTKTSGFTVAAGDANTTFLLDLTSGAFTVTLPAAADVGAGFTVTFIKTDSSGNTGTIDANASETINGATTLDLDTQYDSYVLSTDGAEWFIQQQSLDAASKTYVDAGDFGDQTISVPASAMYARDTNGAESGSTELATNDVMAVTFDFDAGTSEGVQFQIPMPKSWDEGTITAQFLWSHPSTATNFDVVWGLRAISFGNDDALDASWGTAQEVTDTGGTTDDLYISAATSAITIAGTPAEGDMVIFEAYRDAANGSDTLAVDARLHAVKIIYTTDAGTDD